MRPALVVASLLALTAGAWGVAGARSPAAGSSLSSPSSSPLSSLTRSLESFDGQAAQVVGAGPYTYVQVRSDDGALRWTVCLKREIAPGSRVHVRSFGTQEQFVSKRLGRTLDKLWFAIVTPGTPSAASNPTRTSSST